MNFAIPEAHIVSGNPCPTPLQPASSQTTFTRPYPVHSHCFLELAHRLDPIFQPTRTLVECRYSQNPPFIASLESCLEFSQLLYSRTSPVHPGESGLTEVSVRVGVGFLLWSALGHPCTLSRIESMGTLRVCGKRKRPLALESGGSLLPAEHREFQHNEQHWL